MPSILLVHMHAHHLSHTPPHTDCRHPHPTCTHIPHTHSSALGDHVSKDKVIPLCPAARLIAAILSPALQEGHMGTIPSKPAVPTRILSTCSLPAMPRPSAPRAALLPKKPSLTHPTPSLPSSHHHSALLHFQRRNNLHMYPVWFIHILTLF